jgi:hypothetical protein
MHWCTTCSLQAANEKMLLEQAKAAEITSGNTIKAELAAHMKQADERNKALREKEHLLSDNDARIKDLEKSRRWVFWGLILSGVHYCTVSLVSLAPDCGTRATWASTFV